MPGRVERHEAERLGGRRVDHLPNIDPEFVADQRQSRWRGRC